MADKPTVDERILDLFGPTLSSKEWEQAQEDGHRRMIIVHDALWSEGLVELIDVALSPKDEVLGELVKSMQPNDRARLAYILGLIQKKTMQDLHRLHNIRNKWAHLDEPEFSAREWKRDVLALSVVGSKKSKVTKKNYMMWVCAALVKCGEEIVEAATQRSKDRQKGQHP